MAKKRNGKNKGYSDNVPGMRGRRKGGKPEGKGDGFDRSNAGTLASLGDAWLAKLEERAYSPRTLDMHRWSLKSFTLWCHQRDLVKASDITKPILESYQRWLFHYRQDGGKGKPLSVTTQRNRLGVVQRLFAWLCRDNRLPANPAADLQLPRQPPKMLPKALSQRELNKLLSMPDTADPLGLRDRTILEVLYSCGLRRTEVTRLDTDHLDRERGVVAVRGKGGKHRVVPVGELALAWLERYLEDSRPLLEIDRNERALFLSGYGERFNPNYLGNWVKRTMVAAGIDKPGSCHLLRHTCATHMHEGGADIRHIQALLGHARLDTTQIYTEVSIHRLREVHARTHPHGVDKRKRKNAEDDDNGDRPETDGDQSESDGDQSESDAGE